MKPTTTERQIENAILCLLMMRFVELGRGLDKRSLYSEFDLSPEQVDDAVGALLDKQLIEYCIDGTLALTIKGVNLYYNHLVYGHDASAC